MTAAPAVLVRDADPHTTCDLDLTSIPDPTGTAPGECGLDRRVPGATPTGGDRWPAALAPAATDLTARGIPLAELWTGRSGLLRVCRAVGASLADLHREPLVPGRTPTATPPGVLTGDLTAAAPRQVLTAVRDTDVRRALTSAARAWQAETWVHGDVSLDAIWLDTGVGRCEQKSCRVRFVDRELSGAGLPGWDLAGVVDALLTASRAWGLGTTSALVAFGEAYRAGGGPARPSAALNCAMALHRACAPTTPHTAVPALVDRAVAAAHLVRT